LDGGLMDIQDKLVKLKDDINKVQTEIERNEGRLGGLYDELLNALELAKSTKRKVIIQQANKKIQTLKSEVKEQENQLKDLMQEIEQETQEWDSDDD
jgi:vacuolar-type H+-ATPase subunit H